MPLRNTDGSSLVSASCGDLVQSSIADCFLSIHATFESSLWRTQRSSLLSATQHALEAGEELAGRQNKALTWDRWRLSETMEHSTEQVIDDIDLIECLLDGDEPVDAHEKHTIMTVLSTYASCKAGLEVILPPLPAKTERRLKELQAAYPYDRPPLGVQAFCTLERDTAKRANTKTRESTLQVSRQCRL